MRLAGSRVPASARLLLLTAALAARAAETPTPVRYVADSTNSSLEFSFVQAGATNKGRFTKFGVTLDFAPDNLAASRLTVTVDVDSLDTGDEERDDTLRGADLFAVSRFRDARFVARKITRTANGYDALGALTLRGVTRDLHVPFSFRAADEQGKPVANLSGSAPMRRLDFGVGQGDWKSTEWVGDEVTVSYNVRLTAATR